MHVDFILEKFRSNQTTEAMVVGDRAYTYGYLLERYEHWRGVIDRKVGHGKVVAVRADYGPDSVTLMLALIETANIFVPFSLSGAEIDDKLEVAQVEHLFEFDQRGVTQRATGRTAKHPLFERLRAAGHPGVVIFSSGSTGKPKGAVHDFTFLLNKFKVGKRTLRTVTFLLFDHWGGINTLLYIFSNAGTVGMPGARTPDAVCRFIEQHRIELLPATPTFLTLILMDRSYETYDLSSLKTISYGTEPMPQSILAQLHRALPNVELKQTYGLTELGVMRTRSRGSESLWLQVGGEDYQTRIVDGVLHIKAKSAILGYLNAPWPFDVDGWYRTGDLVEQDGDWIRFVGRETDVINVGGQKVHPSEVESVLLEMENVIDATVYKASNPILGNVVGARLTLREPKTPEDVKRQVREHCRGRLDRFKIPVQIEIATELDVTDRFKKRRGGA